MSANKKYLPASHQNFITLFNSIAYHRRRYEVFSDFVVLAGIALHNRTAFSDRLEQDYMNTIGKYTKVEATEISELLGMLSCLLLEGYSDVLGKLFMELELGNDRSGQFFTPPSICKLMADLSFSELNKLLKVKPFVTLSEPASGSGGMVLAYASTMAEYGYNPTKQLYIECWDIDRVVAFMCYVQLSLCGLPAKVVVGNTLTQEVWLTLYSPVYYLDTWHTKLNEW